MKQILEDLLRPNLRLVICGTAAGTRSAQIGAYYAGPGNKFWRTIHAIGLTPHLVRPEDWRSLDAFGIGFTDMAKHHFGMDKDLPAGCFDPRRLQAAIEAIQPGALAFNGKAAAQAFFGRKPIEYGRHDRESGRRRYGFCRPRRALPQALGVSSHGKRWQMLSEPHPLNEWTTFVDFHLGTE